jgi:hypothetical protein
MTEHLNEAGEPWLLTSIDNGVACATLNRPEARNALAMELREDLKAFLVSLRTRPDAISRFSAVGLRCHPRIVRPI